MERKRSRIGIPNVCRECTQPKWCCVPPEGASVFDTMKVVPLQNWVICLMHLLDAFAYFSLSFNFVLYLSDEYDVNDVDAGFYYGLWGGFSVVVGIPSGIAVDLLGVKISLILGSLITMTGRVGITFAPTLTLFTMAVLVATVGGGLLKSALHIAIDRYSSIRSDIGGISFSMLYTSMNIGAMFAGLSTDAFLRIEMFETFGQYRALFAIGSLVSFVNFVIAYTFKEPTNTRHYNTLLDNALSKKGRIETIKGYRTIFMEKTFWALFFMNVFLIGVASMFRFMETILPKYLIRVFGDDVAYGTIQSINPVLIIFFAPIVGIIFRNIKEMYWVIVVGSFLSGISSIVIPLASIGRDDGTSGSLSTVIIYLVIFTIGEAIYSPKVTQYSLKLSPVDKKGIYSGLIIIPSFAGKLVSGVISGILLDDYCPEVTTLSTILIDPPRCEMLWVWVVLLAISSSALLVAFSKCLRVSDTFLEKRDELAERVRDEDPFDIPMDDLGSSSDEYDAVLSNIMVANTLPHTDENSSESTT